MKKPKAVKVSVPQYSVEILTASREGLQAFLNKLKAIRAAHPPGRRLGRDADGGLAGATVRRAAGIPFKDVPIGAVTNSILAKYIGPLNRSVVTSRVAEYEWEMRGGSWWFTPDPVVVTDEGHIINGQHRLMAVEGLLNADLEEENNAMAKAAGEKTTPDERAEAKSDLEKIRARQYPQFVVVWGVDKRAAILMDEARRSSADRRDIALRYAQASGK